MLSAMLQCASHDTPVLVWACTLTQGQQAIPAVEVANQLQLTQLRHPWKVGTRAVMCHLLSKPSVLCSYRVSALFFV